MRAYVRSLDPRLSRAAWILLSGSFANAFGNGVVFPFLLIYLHNVRGIPLGTAGLALAAMPVAGLVAGPVVGAFVDRVGARATLAFAMVVSVVGYGGFALVHHAWQAFLLAALAGVGNGAFWPSHSVLIAGLTAREGRHNAYAMQRVLNNLGIGVGGVVGGLIATTAHPSTYQVLFVIDALTFVAYIVALAFVPSPPHVERAPGPVGGYGRVLRHKTFVGFVVMNAAVIGIGFSLLGDIFPAFAKNDAGVNERGIGFAFLANTLVIVVAQLPVAKALEGRRRMVAYTVEGALWAVSWLVVFAGGLWLTGSAAAAVFAFALAIFGVGECFHGTVQNALIADLAKPGLLGRYMALNGFAFQLGGAFGRAIGGFALATIPHALWVIAATAAFAGGLGALALERFLPPPLRRTPRHVAPQPVAEPV
jgi:MFS family permease